MKLLSCRIENFGKLSDLSFDFTEGLNIIREDNGFGKSTLASFIRAMFYGLEGERKKSIGENERKKYRPWQGGVFGGELDFKAGEKAYRVTRVFGDKEAGDRFELRDLSTNLPSRDFSPNIGEELFGINREAFLKTVFIEQSMCETSPNDDVNARIGQLSYNSNDLNSFESATKKLTDIINALNPRRASGSISKRRDEIAGYEMRVRSGEGIEDTIAKYQGLYNDAAASRQEIALKLKDIHETREKALRQERAIADGKEWERLKAALSLRKARKEECGNKFKGSVPETYEINNRIGECRAMEKASQRMEIYAFLPGEREDLDKFDNVFSGGAPSGDVINRMLDEALRLKNLERDGEDYLAGQKKKREKKALAFTVIGVIIALIGLAAAITLDRFRAAGLILIAAGVLSGVYGALILRKSDEVPSEISLEISGLKETLTNFLYRYDALPLDPGFTDDLYKLREKAGKYGTLCRKRDEFNNARHEYNEYRQKLEVFIDSCGYETDGDLMARLEEIRDNAQGYRTADESYKEAKDELLSFEELNPVSELSSLIIDETLPSVESLDREYKELTGKNDALLDALRQYDRALADLGERLDEWGEEREKLKELRELQAKEQKRFELVSIAREKLEKAKEAMTARYSEPIWKSFTRCFEMIAGEGGENFHIDANTKVTVAEQGVQRDTDTLSSGYRDLIGFCLRIALIDAMYQDELPPLIMDDPFTNLDDDKVALGIEFITRLSETYQIIYLTCSHSRSVD